MNQSGFKILNSHPLDYYYRTVLFGALLYRLPFDLFCNQVFACVFISPFDQTFLFIVMYSTVYLLFLVRDQFSFYKILCLLTLNRYNYLKIITFLFLIIIVCTTLSLQLKFYLFSNEIATKHGAGERWYPSCI